MKSALYLFLNMIALTVATNLAMKKIVELKAQLIYTSCRVVPYRKVVTKIVSLVLLGCVIMYSSSVMFYMTAR